MPFIYLYALLICRIYIFMFKKNISFQKEEFGYKVYWMIK